jgi:hypothetical protein
LLKSLQFLFLSNDASIEKPILTKNPHSFLGPGLDFYLKPLTAFIMLCRARALVRKTIP